MIKNFTKTTVRLKNKSFTFINVFGLALGLATCLLIVFYVFDELSCDRYNINYEGIYRENTDLKYDNNETLFAITAQSVADAMVKAFPEMWKSIRIAMCINFRFKGQGGY